MDAKLINSSLSEKTTKDVLTATGDDSEVWEKGHEVLQGGVVLFRVRHWA
jgi:hypothetical protein